MNKTDEAKNLGKIAKTLPHFLASIILSPIAAPYEVFGVLFNYDNSPAVEGHVDARLYNFLERNKLLNFWGDGFRKFEEAVREYGPH